MFFGFVQYEVDSEENIFVLDGGNCRIQKFDREGRFLQSFGRKGQGPGEFEQPRSIYLDKNNRITKSKYIKMHELMKRWENAIIVFDQAGDRVDAKAVREFMAKYPGRVYLAFYREDRKSTDLVNWDDTKGFVVIDRNKVIQLVIDEMIDRCIPLFGKEAEWWDYWLHWDKIYRVSEEIALGTLKYKWLRTGRDDWVHATLYWRVGMSRFSRGKAKIFEGESVKVRTAPTVDPEQTITYNPRKTDTKTIAKSIDSWRIY